MRHCNSLSNLQSYPEEGSVAYLVLDTESCSIYILDQKAFTILDSLGLLSPPVFLIVSGLFDLEYRIVVANRRGELCVLRRGWYTAKVFTALNSLVSGEKNVTVATMDNCLVSLCQQQGIEIMELELILTFL